MTELTLHLPLFWLGFLAGFLAGNACVIGLAVYVTRKKGKQR